MGFPFEPLTKRGTPPPKYLHKKGTEFFAAGDINVLRHIDSKSKPTAFVVLPGLRPAIVFFFFFLAYIAGERD